MQPCRISSPQSRAFAASRIGVEAKQIETDRRKYRFSVNH
jgi:hypothetical protein